MESFLRRLAILEYLRVSAQPKTTIEVLRHLIGADYLWGDQEDRSLLRTVQRDMKFLLGEPDEEGDYSNEFGLEQSPAAGRTITWQLSGYANLHYDFEKMPQYMALAFAMTRKHLNNVLPKNTARELSLFFQHAESKLEQSEKSLSPKLYKRLNDSIEFYQRGQRLQPAPFDIDILDTIYRAIIQNRQLAFSYRNKDYQVHPYGVAILLPKLYLVCKKDQDHDKPEAEGFRSFLLNKIEAIYVTNQTAKIPEAFRLKDYLDRGEMDVLLDNDRTPYPMSVSLYLPSVSSNLIEDLNDNPISEDQTIEKIDELHFLLRASVRRTVQLRNWLLSLGDAGEVIAPDIIRRDIQAHLQSMMQRYNG